MSLTPSTDKLIISEAFHTKIILVPLTLISEFTKKTTWVGL